MREIKFRVWDKDAKKWLPTEDMPILGENVSNVLDLGDSGYAIFSQFTGLHDKNGSKIYEGDIVNVRRLGEKRWSTGSVFYSETMAQYLVKCFYSKDAKSDYYSFRFSEIDAYLEVIGNIYESPELLNARGPEINDYVSGGRNPNYELTCRTCRFRDPDLQYPGWGWCSIRNGASVSPTGGCEKHEMGEL